MPPGATSLGDNRFALLTSSPHAKRKKTSTKILDVFPELPPTKSEDPKFIIISSSDPNKPLSNFSCFAVHKVIIAICKEVNSISELRDGSLLLLAKNKQAAEKFISASYLPGVCKIVAKYHDNLNLVKGTIFAPFLNNVPEDEIVEGLKAAKVVSVFKFKRIVEGALKPTGVMLLSFDSYFLPEKIDIAWRLTPVRPYFPNPMRCKSCQKLGHTIKHCKNPPACDTCSLPPHAPVECARIFCTNCSGSHTASSNICPKFQQSKEILKIKTLNKCTMREALNKFKAQAPLPLSVPTFANITKANTEYNLTNKDKNSVPAVIKKTVESNSTPTIKNTNNNNLTKPNNNIITNKTGFPDNSILKNNNFNLTLNPIEQDNVKNFSVIQEHNASTSTINNNNTIINSNNNTNKSSLTTSLSLSLSKQILGDSAAELPAAAHLSSMIIEEEDIFT